MQTTFLDWEETRIIDISEWKVFMSFDELTSFAEARNEQFYKGQLMAIAKNNWMIKNTIGHLYTIAEIEEFEVPDTKFEEPRSFYFNRLESLN